MTRVARVLVGFALIAPWLGLTPLASSAFAAVLLSSLALLAAFHGWGTAVALVAASPGQAPLRTCWGIAAVIGLAGVAIMLGVYGPVVQSTVVFGGAAIHSTTLALRFPAHVAALARALQPPRAWLAPGFLLLAIGTLMVLGAAGDFGAHPFDDDTHVVAQIARLLETGTLGDALGYPRTNQLGGALGLTALTSTVGDLRVARMGDALGLVVLLALACARLRWAESSSGIWASLMIVLAATFAISPADAAPFWIPVALIVAAFDTWRGGDPTASPEGSVHPTASPEGSVHRVRRALPLALVAGALIALRSEYLPISVVALAGAWWRDRRAWREDLPRVLVLVGGALAVVLPYLIARHLAWSNVAGLVHALVEPRRLALALRVVLFAVATGLLAPLLGLLVRDEPPATRWFAVAIAAGLAGIVSGLFAELGYALRTAWPIGIAALVVFGSIAVERAVQALTPLAAITTLVACISIADARLAPSSTRFGPRFARIVANLGYLRHVDEVATTHVPYARLLARVPGDATVAVWVGRPDLLDYRRHRVIDLRTPRTNRLREQRWNTGPSRLARLVDATGARYLLVEADSFARQRRLKDPLYAAICPPVAWLPVACADDLERIVLEHAIVETVDDVYLVDLAHRIGD